MPPMTDVAQTQHPPDICLLLRVYSEQRWLVAKVIPLLRQLEQPDDIADGEHAAALAYLEVLWLEAGLRAAETDAAAARLDEHTDPSGDPNRDRDRDSQNDRCSEASVVLSHRARRYHAAVRRLRRAVDHRVRALIAHTDGAGAADADTGAAPAARGPFRGLPAREAATGG